MTLKKTQVFIDLDGVLADFEGGFKAAFGFEFKSMNYKDRWELIAAHPNFFGSLQRISKDLVFGFNDTYGSENVHVLSSCPESNFERYTSQKREWTQRNVPELKGMILFSRGGTRKATFMQSKRDILVDDTQENLAAWEVNGGNAIYYNCN